MINVRFGKDDIFAFKIVQRALAGCAYLPASVYPSVDYSLGVIDCRVCVGSFGESHLIFIGSRFISLTRGAAPHSAGIVRPWPYPSIWNTPRARASLSANRAALTGWTSEPRRYDQPAQRCRNDRKLRLADRRWMSPHHPWSWRLVCLCGRRTAPLRCQRWLIPDRSNKRASLRPDAERVCRLR
jgi:hypothetical protein